MCASHSSMALVEEPREPALATVKEKALGVNSMLSALGIKIQTNSIEKTSPKTIGALWVLCWGYLLLLWAMSFILIIRWYLWKLSLGLLGFPEK